MTALGIVLLLIGATLVVIETHVPTLGILAAPGIAALVAGSALAVAGLGGGVGVIVAVALAIAVGSLAGATLLLRKGAAVRRRRVRSGAEGLIGQRAIVRNWSERTPWGTGGGQVQLDGALWRARRAWPELDQGELREGDVVVVEQLNGLTLAVRCADEWELRA